MIAGELVKAYGLPIAVVLLVGFYLLRTMREQSPRDLMGSDHTPHQMHVQVQLIRDYLQRAEDRSVRIEEKMIRIEAKLDRGG